MKDLDNEQQIKLQTITRKDVAQKAKVSVSVVSRVLNNSGYVKKEKRNRVLQVAKELNYVPHPVAMSLQQKRTRQILFYCKDLHNSYNVDMYYGMVGEARKHDYMALLNGNLEFDNIREAMVDGIILQNEFLAEKYVEVYGKNYFLPVVSASYGNISKLPKSIPVIEWDMSRSMESAIEYLRQRGHRRIAYAGPYSYENHNARIDSWKRQMRSVFGANLQKYYLDISDISNDTFRGDWKDIEIGASEEEKFNDKGRIAAELFLNSKPNVTAVICFNDEFAGGFMQLLKEHGVSVPDQLSILSFDGSYRRRECYPILTSVNPDPYDYGAKLVDLLLRNIEGQKIHYYAKQPIKISEGDSVKNIS
jgi:LacI family repressor for deo operon, udp, cdd, tsx, nupC, and nupG